MWYKCWYCYISDYIYLLNDYRIEVDGEIFNIEPEICKPIIKASKIHNEEEIKNNTLKIIWHYTNEAKLIPEDKMIKKYPNAYNYLKVMKSKLKNKSKSKDWYAFGMNQSLKTLLEKSY